MKALIVDDSPSIRKIMSMIMRDLRFEVDEAENGQHGLSKLDGQDGEIHLVLLDWNMPTMNGYQMLTEMRKISKLDAVKVIMVTTEAELDKVDSALKAGANEYVFKPFNKEIMHDKLRLIGFEI